MEQFISSNPTFSTVTVLCATFLFAILLGVWSKRRDRKAPERVTELVRKLSSDGLNVKEGDELFLTR